MIIGIAFLQLIIPATWVIMTTSGWTGERHSSFSLGFAVASIVISVASWGLSRRLKSAEGHLRGTPWVFALAPALMLSGLTAFRLPGEGGYWGAWLYIAGMAAHLLVFLFVVVYSMQARGAFRQ